MGNCNGLPFTGNQFRLHSDPGDSGGLNVLLTPSSPTPQQSSIHHQQRHTSSSVDRVLGRPMEDIRSTYVFAGELGRGQFGITYLVTHKEAKQQLACKCITKRKLINSEDIDDVRREVQIMYHLTGHRNIVELKGAYEDQQSVNLIMEVCGGGELFDRIIAKGHFSEESG